MYQFVPKKIIGGKGMNKFGIALKFYRHSKSMTLAKLAEACGKSAAYICDLECGRKKPPTRSVARDFEEVLDLAEDTLVDLSEECRQLYSDKQKILGQRILGAFAAYFVGSLGHGGGYTEKLFEAILIKAGLDYEEIMNVPEIKRMMPPRRMENG